MFIFSYFLTFFQKSEIKVIQARIQKIFPGGGPTLSKIDSV